MTRKNSPIITALGNRIFNYLREHPHDPITKAELAKAMGTTRHNTNFNMALAQARVQASQAGDIITACSWTPGHNMAMRYLPAGREDGKSLTPLFTRTSATETAIETLRRDSTYTIENADDGVTCLYAQQVNDAMRKASRELDKTRQYIGEVKATIDQARANDAATIASLRSQLAQLQGAND